MNKLQVLIVAGVACIGLVLLFVIMFAIRWFNATTIQSKVIEPKPGVECVVVSSTDGTSVDCWKVAGVN